MCFIAFLISEIQFFANLQILEIQENDDCRLRFRVVIHAFKLALIETFGMENLDKLKLLGLPLHIVTAHLADAFEKSPLPYQSTQLPESVFKLLNQVTTNCHKKDVLKRWLYGLWVTFKKIISSSFWFRNRLEVSV
jgi:hypothetical protein